jgi:uncharacterized protein with FMN-binding domain
VKRRVATTITGLAASAAIAGCSAEADRAASPEPRIAREEAAPEQAAPEEAVYADGTYTATGWYGGLPSRITVSVDLDDDVITDVDVTPHATDPTSLDLQRRFAAAVPDLVVGRPIDEVQLSRVAGSSGTPQGFNDALEQIKAEAAGPS